MGDFLISKGIERGREVAAFELFNVPFSWKSGKVNDDCGVFLMLHMLFYFGMPFECGLGSCEKRKLYRGEIAACLVLSDFNQARADVLASIPALNQVKPLILPVLLDKRERAKNQQQEPEEERLEREKREAECIEAARQDLIGVRFSSPSSRPKVPVVKRKSVGRPSPRGKMQRTGSPSSPIRSDVNVDPCSPSSVLGSRRRGQPDNLGCFLDCGQTDNTAVMASHFMRSNNSLFQSVLLLRKHVCDFVFLDDYGVNENLYLFFRNPSMCASKKDLMSLHANNHMTQNMV